jgi:extracellular matrix regulatory protein B
LFIHLGEDIVIRSMDVIAIIDHQLLDSSVIIREFLQGQQEEKNIKTISQGSAKSVVVTTDQVYISPLSSLTLKRRAQMISELERYEEVE